MNTRIIVSLIVMILSTVVLAKNPKGSGCVPYLVAVYNKLEYFCPGALITPNYLITISLYPLWRKEDITVVAGVSVLDARLAKNAQRRRVVFKEDVYVPGCRVSIAKVDKPFDITGTVSTISLFNGDLPNPAAMNVIGWELDKRESNYKINIISTSANLVKSATDPKRDIVKTKNLSIRSFETKGAIGVVNGKLCAFHFGPETKTNQHYLYASLNDGKFLEVYNRVVKD